MNKDIWDKLAIIWIDFMLKFWSYFLVVMITGVTIAVIALGVYGIREALLALFG